MVNRAQASQIAHEVLKVPHKAVQMVCRMGKIAHEPNADRGVRLMTRTPLRTVIPVGILLLSTISCAFFTNPSKPSRVVDLPPMVGKSLEEMTTLLGPPYKRGICYGWDLAEGVLSACYESRDSASKMMDSISYEFPPPPLLRPSIAAGSPEEMAPFVNIDLQGRKPDVEFRGGYAYDDLILNGRAVDVAFDGGPKTIVGVRVKLK